RHDCPAPAAHPAPAVPPAPAGKMGGTPRASAVACAPMTVTVRDLRSDARADLEGFARVRHAALPFILVTPDSLAHDLAHMPPDARYRPLVAVADGEVIGTAQVHLAHESSEPG